MAKSAATTFRLFSKSAERHRALAFAIDDLTESMVSRRPIGSGTSRVAPKFKQFQKSAKGIRGFAVAIERLRGSLATPQPSHPTVATRSAAARFLHFGPSDRNEASFSAPLSAKIAKCEEILGYTFQSKLLLAEALTLDGGEVYTLAHGGRQCHTHSSSRLAVYGDALMLAYMARQWLQHSPTRLTDSNRSWTTLRHMYLNDRHLLSAAQGLGLTECTHVRTPEQGGLVSPDWGWVAAQTVEAIAAAAYLDGGDRALARVMELVGCDKVFNERKNRQGCEADADVLQEKGSSAIREDHVEQEIPV